MEEDRHVILHNGKSHLAGKEGGKQLAADKSWASDGSAENIYPLISCLGECKV